MSFNLFFHSFKILIPILECSILVAFLVLFWSLGLFAWSSLEQIVLYLICVTVLLYLCSVALSLSLYIGKGARILPIYILILSAIGIAAPILIAQPVATGFEGQIFTLTTTWKETMMTRTLSYSYLLILPYLFEFYIIFAALFTKPERILLPSSKTHEVKGGEIWEIYQKLTTRLGVKPPNLFSSDEPSVYSFGLEKDRSSIVLYKKCSELDQATLEAIVAHELSHVRSDVGHHTLRLFFTGIPQSKLLHLPTVPFVLSVLWFFRDFLYYSLDVKALVILNLDANTVELNVAEASSYFNNVMPLFLALTSFSLVIFANAFLFLAIGLNRPVCELDEFKADFTTYLLLDDADAICTSLDRFRRLQISYYIEKPSTKSTWLHRARQAYNRVMSKGFFSKEYSSWLEYFRQDYGELCLTFGKGFDFPRDRLRKDFVKFIDKLCNQHVKLKPVKTSVRLDTLWFVRNSIFGAQVAIAEWLQEDVYRIPTETRMRVANYLLGNLDSFNAKACSRMAEASLHQVVTIVLALLTDGSLDLTEIPTTFAEMQKRRDN